MSAETDIAACDDGGANSVSEVRTALTSVLARADLGGLIDGGGSDTGIDVASVSPVDIISTSLTVTAGDTYLVELWGSILNDTGGNRSYTFTLNLGAASSDGGGSVFTASTQANPRPFHYFAVITAASSSSWVLYASVDNFISTSLQSEGNWNTSGNQNRFMVDSGSDDATGSTTLSLTVTSSATGDNQLLLPIGYTVRRVT